jgi:hypothetical protein
VLSQYERKIFVLLLTLAQKPNSSSLLVPQYIIEYQWNSFIVIPPMDDSSFLNNSVCSWYVYLSQIGYGFSYSPADSLMKLYHHRNVVDTLMTVLGGGYK